MITIKHLFKTNIYLFGCLDRKKVVCWYIPQAGDVSGLARLPQFVLTCWQSRPNTCKAIEGEAYKLAAFRVLPAYAKRDDKINRRIPRAVLGITGAALSEL